MQYVKLSNGEYGEFVVQNKYRKRNGVWIPAYGDHWDFGPWSKCLTEDGKDCGSQGYQTRKAEYYRLLRHRNNYKLKMDPVFSSDPAFGASKRPCALKSCCSTSGWSTWGNWRDTYVGRWCPYVNTYFCLPNDVEAAGTYRIQMEVQIFSKRNRGKNSYQLRNPQDGKVYINCQAWTDRCTHSGARRTSVSSYADVWRLPISIDYKLHAGERRIRLQGRIIEHSKHNDAGFAGTKECAIV